MAKVTFDGPNRLIIVNNGISTLDVQIDLYSDWKEWVATGDNSKFVPAFSAIGGEPIGGGLYVGSTYLLLNNWKIRPYEGNHTLTLLGNIFGEGGAALIVPTLGTYTVAVQFRNSSLAQGVETTGGGAGTSDWDEDIAAHVTEGTFGSFVQKLLTITKFLSLKD